MITYRIAAQFTKTPGPRYRIDDQQHSGEAFREDVLIPLFHKAVNNKEKILIDLDGGYGYSSSFLDEAFGGLAKVVGVQLALEYITFKSEEEHYLPDDIKTLMEKHKNRK